ncbi:uncharacterized protein LOC141905488 [Tubulanus polymorphus]|uniref:uncharacterized protein LOC141905488 n=1 Tax=Tubulanus polymorphus TaxID=672921 RepID=UPI003DA4C52A
MFLLYERNEAAPGSMAFSTAGNNNNEQAWSIMRRNSQHLTPLYLNARPPSLVYSSDSPTPITASDLHGGGMAQSFKFPSPATTLTPTVKMNGDLNQYDVAKPALSGSRPSLVSKPESLVELDYGIDKSILSLGLMALTSLVLALFSTLFLFRLGSMQADEPLMKNKPSTTLRNRLITSVTMYENFQDVTIALCSFILMLNLCCLLVSSMQCFYAAKILKVPQGELRAFKYLKECNNSRFLAATGLFISIPITIIAMILYMLMEFNMISAIIGSVVLAIGIIFCLFSMVHDTYFWCQEKKRAFNNEPIYDNPMMFCEGGGGIPGKKNELSTLV